MGPSNARRGVWVGVVVVVLAVIGGGLWWRQHPRAPAAPATSAAGQRGGPAGTAVARAAPVAPARVAITVRDERGPIAEASVRLAPSDGEIIVVRTGRDGVARADALEPGRWKVSASAVDHEPAALPETTLAAGVETALAIELVSGGRTLRGTVSDATGGPITGARIDAARLTTAARPGDAVATTFTAVDGTYHLSVAPGLVMVAAASADYAPQARKVEIGAAGAVADFALVPGGLVEGIVLDERTRQPVAGARVVAAHDSPMQLAETSARHAIAGGDGRFRLGGLRPGAWSLTASEGARFSKQPVSVGLGVAEQVGGVELRIGAGPAIRGTVVDETGAPAGNVEVHAFARGAFARTTADAGGAFVFERIGPGDYGLSASGGSYLPGATTQVALSVKDVDGVVVKVARGATVRGHVEPRQACEIQRGFDEGRMQAPAPPVSSGSDGEFVLGAVRDGALRLTARCAGGDQGATQVRVSRGMADVVIKVTAGGSIAGHVVDGDGKPVAGAGVVAADASGREMTMINNGALTSGAQTVSDATGAYLIGGLAPGSYQLDALDRGAMVPARKGPRVELAGSERKAGVDLVIDRPTGVIAGTVTGPDGKPVADAWVTVELDTMATMSERTNESAMVAFSMGPAAADSGFPPVLTDAQGHYEVRGLPRAIYGVTAEAQHGELRAHVERVKPDATVNVQLTAVAVLSGTVTGPAGPAALFSVELEGPSHAERSFAGGAFSFGRIDPGNYTVRVTSAEGNAHTSVVIKPGEPATLALTLVTNAIVIGTLVDATGAPLAGVAVILQPDRGEADPTVMLTGPPQRTGPDGRFRIEHAAERCVLIVLPSDPGHQQPFSKAGLGLEPGKTLDLGTVTVTPQKPGPGGGPGSGAPPPSPPLRQETRAPAGVLTAARR